MSATTRVPKVVIIPAKQQETKKNGIQRQLRVAAYCRVSTDDEEQLSSYEAQKTYYTDKIMTNKDWTMAGIFADEGITGTSARKRPEFLKLVRQCEQGKIDVVLIKSISRFARNTVDSLSYIRKLKELGVAVIFEKENINTMETSSEVFIALYSAFAQGESESIRENVSWGIKQAMREGKTNFQYKWLYGYRKGEDGEPEIIPEEAEIVRSIFDDYLAGASLRMIAEALDERGIPARGKKGVWCTTAIRSILINEKYCGDALLQKTFTLDCISKKVIKNTGQLPMYLIQDHHDAIVSRETFNAVKAEMARRNAGKSTSQKNAPTGRTSYTSKFALSDRLVCGECGTLYRRCTWTSGGKKRVVWRCISRIEYGKKYCKHSQTIKEEAIQEAILKALNSILSQKEVLIKDISGALELELAPIPGESMSIADIERRLDEIGPETMKIVTSISENGGQSEEDTVKLKALVDEAAMLKQKKTDLLKRQEADSNGLYRVNMAKEVLNKAAGTIQEWDESMIRQLVDTVKIVSASMIEVTLRCGVKIEQAM